MQGWVSGSDIGKLIPDERRSGVGLSQIQVTWAPTIAEKWLECDDVSLQIISGYGNRLILNFDTTLIEQANMRILVVSSVPWRNRINRGSNITSNRIRIVLSGGLIGRTLAGHTLAGAKLW